MKKIQIVSITLMALITLSTVSAASATTFEEKQLTVKQNANFTISLEDISASTGFCWARDYDSNFLKLLNEKIVVNNEQDPFIIGIPATHSYTFKALKKGQTKLKFIQSRPWSNEMPSKVVTYNVTIK